MTRPSATTVTTRLIRPAAWIIALLLLLSANASSAELVVVALTSGRQFTAEVDAQTDDKALVLRFDGATTVLWRPIAWDRVAEVRRGDEAWSGDTFRTVASEYATTRDQTIRQQTTKAAVPVADVNATAGETRVHALYMEARIANWDADAGPDGLLVTVAPLDAIGNPVELDGTISVELIAARPAALRSRYAYHRGPPVEKIGRWTRTLRRSDFLDGHATLQLPFETIDPATAQKFDALGQVQASLTAPGHGVFSATADVVRIRPFSPVRDAELQSGRP